MDGPTLHLGVLIEAADRNQKSAEAALGELGRQAKALDVIVRDEIRRTLTEELADVYDEAERAIAALTRLQRGLKARLVVLTAVVSTISTCAAMAIGAWYVPSRPEITSLRVERDRLTAVVQQLEARTQGLPLDTCGKRPRLCVRVDKEAGTFGPAGDYFLIAGR